LNLVRDGLTVTHSTDKVKTHEIPVCHRHLPIVFSAIPAYLRQ